MNMDNVDYKTPGQLIEACLAAKGWSQRVLAIVLGMDETGINKLIAGKRAITAEIALILEELFGVPAKQFMDLQQRYDLAKAQIVMRPDAGRNIRAHLFGGLPVAEIIRRGWLQADDIRNVPAAEAALAKFFGVASPTEIEILPFAAKKTAVTGEANPTQLAWLYRVKEIAGGILTAPYSPASVRRAIPKLSAWLASPEETRKVPRILMESGIRFVIVESLPYAKIDGVCMWLDDKTPVIGISLRHDRIDNFWFVLRHELEHVIRLHGRRAIMLDTELQENIASVGIPEEEQVANEAAAEFCVPKKDVDGFIARKSPLFSERDVLGFARTMNLHPGLIVGQLQSRTGRYELFRKHLVRVRAAIAPSAIVDGWGDIAPVVT